MDERATDEAVRPRSEPEILPPERPGEARFARRQHVFITRPGPLAIVLALGAVSLALAVFLLGAFIIALPVLGALAAAVIATAFVRGAARRRLR